MVFFLPKTLKDFLPFIALAPTELVHVPGGQAVWVDYEVMRRDFSFLATYSEAEIDAFIEREFSYVSKEQLALVGSRNSEIPTSGKTKTSYRQINFGSEHQEFQGRGDTMEVVDPSTGLVAGVIDRKGVGISKQKLKENQRFEAELSRKKDGKNKFQLRKLSNGLMFLGEALIEAAAMKVTQKVFEVLNHDRDPQNFSPNVPGLSVASLQTIEGYFVLKLPFQVYAGDNPSQPAAIYARQGHVGRLWAGKIFTSIVNIKQTDFFAALCDGGTVRIRMPELKESTQKIKGGPVLTAYQEGRDIVDRVLAGEKGALAKVIDEVLLPLQDRLNNVNPEQPIGFKTGEEAFIGIVRLIQNDPIRFCRFAEVLWFVAVNSPEWIEKHRIDVAAIARHYLSLPKSVKDIDGSNKPMRRWGLLLLGTLPSADVESAVQRELSHWIHEPEFLARSYRLWPRELQSHWLKTVNRRAGLWLQANSEGAERPRPATTQRQVISQCLKYFFRSMVRS